MNRPINPEMRRCSWCDARCRDHDELMAHRKRHIREDAEAQKNRTIPQEKAA